MTGLFLVTDQVGTLRAVADSAGTILKRVDYDSFGNIINDTNPGFSVPFGFAGGLHDRDTGLVRFGYRDYSPELGRCVAKDPIDFAGGDTNLYEYVMNDPVNLVDPSGLAYLDINFSVGAGVGITFGAMYTSDGAVYPYVGGGAMTSPGVSVTSSPGDPSLGYNTGYQRGLYWGGQIGYAANGGPFVEQGFVSPGWSLTGYWVFGPIGGKMPEPGLAKCH